MVQPSFLTVCSYLVCIRLVFGVDLTGTSPFQSLGCKGAIPPTDGWIFETWPTKDPCHSCYTQQAGEPLRGDAASMCVDASGKPDYTSIFVDMQSLEDKSGCFGWTSSECTMDLTRVSSIEFDIDLQNCNDIWAAPLWITPTPWVGPGQVSGEVDMVELCPAGSVATNFGAAGNLHENEKVWSSASGLGVPRHFVMTIKGDSGDLQTTVCNLDGSNCVEGGYYLDFLDTVNSAKSKNSTTPYTFTSDVWNGIGGDGGWSGCKAQNNRNTTCQFAVMNIRVHSNDATPMFGSGKCMALNGQSGVRPSTQLAQSPTLLPAPSDTVVV